MTTEGKLESFRSLQPGWNFGSGVAPSDMSLNQARQALRMYMRAGLHETDAFCGPEGEIMVTAYVNGHYIEIDIVMEESVNFLHEDNHGNTLEKTIISFQELENHIRKAVQGALGESWLSSASLTQPTTTAAVGSSITMRSRIPAQMVVHQFSSLHAPSQYREARVTILNVFTKELEVSRPHTGSLNYPTSSLPKARKSFATRLPRHLETSVTTTSTVPAMAIFEGLSSHGHLATLSYALGRA